jgi:ligand-binding sensor domain-containing protein
VLCLDLAAVICKGSELSSASGLIHLLQCPGWFLIGSQEYLWVACVNGSICYYGASEIHKFCTCIEYQVYYFVWQTLIESWFSVAPGSTVTLLLNIGELLLYLSQVVLVSMEI